MKIYNIFNKKTPFEALGIDESSSNKYEQLYNQIADYDDVFAMTIIPAQIITDDKYIEDRLFGVASSLTEQFLEIYKDRRLDIFGFYEFSYFKETMNNIGGPNFSVEDWANVATAGFIQQVKENPFENHFIKQNTEKYASAASYIGYIDLKSNNEFMAVYDDLQIIKEKYQEKMQDVVRDAQYYKNSDKFDYYDLKIARNFFEREMGFIIKDREKEQFAER